MQALEWVAHHDTALEPAGLVAAGRIARQLLAHLQTIDEQKLRQLSIVATRDLLVLIGANDLLPWLDGVRYCAPDPAARDLWLPTHLMPRLPADLLQTNLASRLNRKPVLLWNDPEHILPLDKPLSLTPALLTWLIQEFD